MSLLTTLTFKLATEEAEFEQIFRLNYKTFVEEIPQHPPDPAKRLVDKFHQENNYLICLVAERVVGMVAVRDKRPFSLDQKLADLDTYLPQGRRICEIRLLAVEKGYRNGRILYSLMRAVGQYCQQQGYDLAIISGTVREQKLYQHLGFAPFGPLVGTPEALFQPMYLTLEAAQTKFPSFFQSEPVHS